MFKSCNPAFRAGSVEHRLHHFLNRLKPPPHPASDSLVQPPLDSLPAIAQDRFMPPQLRTKYKGAIYRIPNRSNLAS
jgi:hypothetical protein